MANKYEIINTQSEEERMKLLVKKNNAGKLVEFAKNLLFDKKITVTCKCAISLISLLEQQDLVKQVTTELITALNTFVSSAPVGSLQEISQHFLDVIMKSNNSCGKSFEVLGQVLNCLEACRQTVSCDGEEFTGPEYRSHLINKICSVRWPQNNILHIGQMFQDITVSQSEMAFFIEKICSSLSLVKFDVVPQIVHLLLLSAAKGHHKKVVFELTSNFNDMEEKEQNDQEEMKRDVESERSQAEGTSLLHISFAVKHDLELGKAINQHIKSSKKLTPFTLGLGLSLTQHDRFSEQVLSCLKGGVSRALRGSKLWAASKFIHGVVDESKEVKQLLEVVLRKSNNGWDYVTEGLIKLGFILLDSSGSESDVGVFILEECYKLHVHCRSSVMTDLLHRIVTSSPLTSGTLHSLLLARISRRSVQLLLSQSNMLKDNLSNVPMIPLKNARCVLRAVVPVMRYDTSLRDAAILTFRKTLFSKNPDNRRIAVFGLTEMMKKFKVGDNYSQSSQLSCSQVQVHLMVTDDINEAVCTEILLLLKRGLTQQGSVRSDIYNRLASILRSNSKLYPMILQLLEERLVAVTEQDPGILPPIKLGNCIAVLPDQSVLREPVMDLLRATFTCCALVKPREQDDVMKLDELLTSVTLRSTKCDLEDWDLDKGAEFSNTGVGSRNLVTALSLTAILEVLLENELNSGKGTTESGERFKKLFRSMYSVQEILSEKQGGGRGKKSKTTLSHFSLEAVDMLLDYLIVNDMTEHEEFVGNLKTVTNLLTWTLGLLSDHLKKIISDDEEEDNKNQVYTLGSITKSLLCHLSRDKSLFREQAASLLDKSIRVVNSSHMDKLEEYCETSTGSSEITGLRDKITPLFNKAVIAEDFTEAQHLLSAMDVLYSMCESQSSLEDILLKLLDNPSLTSGFSKDVVSILLSSLRRSSDKLDIQLALARDILAEMGDIETEDEDSMIDEVKYKLVSENSAGKLLSVLLTSVDSVLSDIEWGIQQGKSGDDQSDLLCQYLMQVATVLSVCLTCKSPHSSSTTDLLSRTTKKFYNTFTLQIKRESSHNHGILKSLEKLAKLVGTSTNQKLYSFLIYLEQPLAENIGTAQNAATIRKQAVSVPGLIYAVEQCERNLIILSKKTKTDLMEHFKRSPARDFKVNMKVLEEKFTKVEEDGEDTEKPKKKRKRGKNKENDD
ncbi:Fanconi anemia group I protein homolog [Bolinopsis microptera]|uniref:Fanconi anemia group I protein homolog n=1 Tax=Bolinopsis microptera TaxID=2820187 RepID=UPI00307A7B09